ncbi:MAG: glycine cleavage system aminomethyltransferase GcvT [Chthoniobacterales bacterium]
MALHPGALKQTPLFEEHVKLNAKMIEFGGWNMPVFYLGILAEHQAVRNRVGMFDISHMGQIEVSGPSAAKWLNTLLTNNLEKLSVGECQYTFLLNERGGVIDDLIVYRRTEAGYLMVVNAAKTDEDHAWLQSHSIPEIELINQSEQYAAVAVQGPSSAVLFNSIGQLPPRNHLDECRIAGTKLLVARTGYTGEDGFEVFYPAAAAAAVWERFLELGKPLGIQPCGLGARDTLRLEVCYPLNGADLSELRTPLEAGLGLFVDLEKACFIGREALLAQKKAGPKQRLVALKVPDKSPPLRAHYGLFAAERQIGELTSGTLSPSLGVGIGLGYVEAPFARPGQKFEIDIRGRRFPATVEKKPLYKRDASS